MHLTYQKYSNGTYDFKDFWKKIKSIIVYIETISKKHYKHNFFSQTLGVLDLVVLRTFWSQPCKILMHVERMLAKYVTLPEMIFQLTTILVYC